MSKSKKTFSTAEAAERVQMNSKTFSRYAGAVEAGCVVDGARGLRFSPAECLAVAKAYRDALKLRAKEKKAKERK
jgi:hypothetical protein